MVQHGPQVLPQRELPSMIEKLLQVFTGDPRVCGADRSSQWGKVRDEFLKENNSCAVCGHTKSLNVHHIQPFHLYPDLELSPSNLITLGEKCPTGNHHLFVGHLGNWSSYNVNVRHDAYYWLNRIKARP